MGPPEYEAGANHLTVLFSVEIVTLSEPKHFLYYMKISYYMICLWYSVLPFPTPLLFLIWYPTV